MDNLEIEIIDCPFCGSNQKIKIPYFLFETPAGDVLLQQCTACGLIYQSPRLTEESLKKVYDKEYFEMGEYGGKDKTRSYFNESEQSDISRFHEKILKRIQKFKDPPARLVEIGCAGGHFLLDAREKGFQVQGVEISDYAAREARDRYNLDVATGTLEEVKFAENSIDIVYCKDVLEHVRDPRFFLDTCYRILKPDGLLVILVPDYIESPMMRMYSWIWKYLPQLRRKIWTGRRKYILNKPFHILEFTEMSLIKFLELSNFKILRKDNYTLPPLATRQGALFVHSIRFVIRWFYYLTVQTGILRGDRLDVYCGK